MNGPFRINRADGKILGVAAGLADYSGLDATIVRLALIALTLFTGPVFPIAYFAVGALAPQPR